MKLTQQTPSEYLIRKNVDEQKTRSAFGCIPKCSTQHVAHVESLNGNANVELLHSACIGTEHYKLRLWLYHWHDVERGQSTIRSVLPFSIDCLSLNAWMCGIHFIQFSFTSSATIRQQVHGDVGHTTENARTFTRDQIGRPCGTKRSIFGWFSVNTHRFHASANVDRRIGPFVSQLRRRYQRFADTRRSRIYDNVSQTCHTIRTEMGGGRATSGIRGSNYDWFHWGELRTTSNGWLRDTREMTKFWWNNVFAGIGECRWCRSWFARGVGHYASRIDAARTLPGACSPRMNFHNFVFTFCEMKIVYFVNWMCGTNENRTNVNCSRVKNGNCHRTVNRFVYLVVIRHMAKPSFDRTMTVSWNNITFKSTHTHTHGAR